MDQVLVDHGHKGNTMLGCKGSKDLVEGRDVVRPIVGRKCNTRQKNLDMRRLKRGKNLIEVLARLIERQPAKPVIAAELDDDHLWVKAENRRKAGHGVLGGGSTGTLIDDLVVIALRVELPLQRIRKRLAIGQSITGGYAVAEADQDIGWCSHEKTRQQQRAD